MWTGPEKAVSNRVEYCSRDRGGWLGTKDFAVSGQGTGGYYRQSCLEVLPFCLEILLQLSAKSDNVIAETEGLAAMAGCKDGIEEQSTHTCERRPSGSYWQTKHQIRQQLLR